ncbi:putative secreted protein with C-terminal beta-propeller domain [Sedimentibacter acidaminivorans]|uniref:Secreted protein with C-terminal beta-propeller domain n=1 Tax=Sedimentibacter acidaminivorans TaxID=913099 RepID=A0ABS4GFB6_9FIRM|nr:beta-propeller domain-containing protein [Sedimentibacter acidaminivorans]MBP1926390.1 putative secreted protein with C-terminal beta-propeller domain [Sedimentibacter acidaminivorans]
MKNNKFLRKIIALTLILALCFSVSVFAEDECFITVYVNNEKVEFDANPILENGRTLVPLRGVFEKLDAKVDWNKNTMQAVIKDENNEIEMMLNKNKVLVNGEIKDIDSPTKMINSRTFAPLRFISETLGHDIRWDEKTNSVYITKYKSVRVNKNIIPTVGTKDNLIALLEYNSKIYNYIGLIRPMVMEKTEDAAFESAAEAPTASGSDSSNTNNQVEGVEEGDIVKNDGKHIFIKSYDKVKIIDSNPLNPKIISQVDVPENMDINEIYITEKKLVVIGQNNYYHIYKQNDETLKIGIVPPTYYDVRCNVLIYNIENLEKPVLEREYLFDGNYTSGRTIDNNLYLVTTKYFNLGYYGNYDNNINIPLPTYTDCITNEKTEIGFDKIKYFPNYVDSKYMITVGINLDDKKSEPDVDVYIGSTESIFVSKNNLYATVTDFLYESQSKSTDLYNPIYSVNTVIYKFGLKDGYINPVGQGKVPGNIINQFSMDETDGLLRIATTIGEVWQTGQNESKNNIYILNDSLNIIGKLEGLAPGERIYSTRFMGDKVYMVTFKQVDPLFVIDTSNPNNPKVLGYLKIPGYSTYLHPVDETHILGFGYETVQNEWGGTSTGGFKISLFDVSDVNKPKEIATDIIGKSGTYSELLYNHKALMFSLNKEIMAFPISRAGDNYINNFIGAYVYNINSSKVELKTEITHMKNIKSEYTYENEIKRIIYIGDYLYTFSENKMQVHNINNNEKVNELDLK